VSSLACGLGSWGLLNVLFVLSMLCVGHRAAETRPYESSGHAAVALALGISVRTAHTHTAGICRKLAVAGKRDLVGMPIPSELSVAPIDNLRTGG
jgi:hypothetical protein